MRIKSLDFVEKIGLHAGLHRFAEAELAIRKSTSEGVIKIPAGYFVYFVEDEFLG